MGSCVSTQQKSSAMEVQVLFGSNDINIINGDLAAKHQWSPSKSAPAFRDYGSKEETFFDSQAWLDSDCDDDFMSVNGEFTPSRGNTPVHHNFSAGNTKPHAAVFPYSPSPNGTEKKIRLSDLFKDSLRRNYDFEDEQDGESAQNGVSLKAESPLVHGGEGVANGANGLKTKKERFGTCFPTLLSSRSSSTSGRKMMSPGLGVSPSPNPNPVVG
ncbi:hypothetical protein L1987_46659 [Smallanthus sonchifolius]|uniref:Uncharacterized protein n=1 Tax=Smallanthus sonchifolius TaxID=185202 RepID=A0ACB9G0E6_9ASTR|nr:hypothetical protein L1987_46659 [Smallanthus sonchifolius]